MIKHKTSSDLLAQQTDWQSKSCMFWALELGSIHVKQKKNFVHWKLFPQSDQPAFCHLLCTQCYQKCAAGDHLEMHECAKHWCFMANRIKLSMIPAFSLNLGFLIDALDIKARCIFASRKCKTQLPQTFIWAGAENWILKNLIWIKNGVYLEICLQKYFDDYKCCWCLVPNLILIRTTTNPSF